MARASGLRLFRTDSAVTVLTADALESAVVTIALGEELDDESDDRLLRGLTECALTLLKAGA
jgi:hypothetical protein